jgi:hypothetical protein
VRFELGAGVPGQGLEPIVVSETTAVRTLVKSAPELWAACSDAESLARHLGAFGEIKITRLEPETTVAWEGERASGTVRIESSNWGTKVTMTATLTDAFADLRVAEVEPEPEPAGGVDSAGEESLDDAEPAAVVEPPAPDSSTGARRTGILARLAGWFGRERPPESRPQPAVEADPAPVAVAEPEPLVEPESQPSTQAGTAPEAALDAALDSLGQAHHRPFSQL